MNAESTWGPCESTGRDKRLAQPYRLQQANRSDGQWSRWASDIRQSQPDQWSRVLPDGIRLPATSAHGKECQNGKGQSGLPRLEGP